MLNRARRALDATPNPGRTGRQGGQVLVLFALMIVVLVGFLALIVDLGFLFGQRRYDQNGADAAAYAAGEVIARNIAAYTTSSVYVAVTDAYLYATVRQYTGANQNPSLDSRNQLAVSLEYNPGDGSGWCYSPSGPQPPRSPAIPSCTNLMIADAYGNVYPPLPGTSPYQIRVTVSSTTTTFFAQALPGWSGGVAPTSPQTDPNAPACIIVSATGDTTCAQTVVAVGGSTSGYQGPTNPIPITVCDADLGVGPVGEVYKLGGSAAQVCGISLQVWQQQIVNFSAESTWCDGILPDLAYYYALPPPCPSNDPTWNRGGFHADTTYVGNVLQSHDVPMWLSVGFHGTIAPGIRVPTYGEINPDQLGNEVQYIGLGLYCDNGLKVTAMACSINLMTGTYFFSQSWTDFHLICPDQLGPAYQVGCRETAVMTWSNPEDDVDPPFPPPNVSCETQPGGCYVPETTAPERVTLVRYRDFRVYCGHGTGQTDGSNVCNQPPTGLPGAASASTGGAYGRFVGPYVPSCLTCTAGLNQLNADLKPYGLDGVGVSLVQ